MKSKKNLLKKINARKEDKRKKCGGGNDRNLVQKCIESIEKKEEEKFLKSF